MTNESDAVRDAWERYTSSWSETSAAARLEAFATCLDDDCVYTDPTARTIGHRELSAHMHQFQEHNPGAGFVTQLFRSHHDCVLVEWKMVDAAGGPVASGTSFATVNASGRLSTMTGFFDR
jgi:hypothetical protein